MGYEKHAPHSYVRAVPWESQSISRIGRHCVSLRDVKKRGGGGGVRKEEPAPYTSANAQYGAGVPGAPDRKPLRRPSAPKANAGFAAQAAQDEHRWERSSDAFGSHAVDALGPVDLSAEKTRSPKRGLAARAEPPPDSLRWNPETKRVPVHLSQAERYAVGGPGGREEHIEHGRDLSPRRDREAKHSRIGVPDRKRLVKLGGDGSGAAAAPSGERSTVHDIPDETSPYRERPQNKARNDRALRLEEMQRVRDRLGAERMAQRKKGGGGAPDGELNEALNNLGIEPNRAAALQDPRVLAALDAALNGPNKLAANHYHQRGVVKDSGPERRF